MPGHIALITGGGSGIGLATAKILGLAGHTVILADINELGAQQQAHNLAEVGINAHAIALDVSSEASWQSVMTQIERQFERLDILINNAGIGEGGNVQSTTFDAFQRSMAINVGGVFLGCKYGIALIEKSGGGAVVNVSSIFGIVSDPLTLAYSASKGAVRSMTKSLALDCAERQNGVRVNSVHPGFVETPMVAQAIGSLPADIAEDYQARTVGLVPMARLGQADEIAKAIAFLVSSDASFMTGAELVVDGGFTAR
jgi:NAD(P)-dependent dehydrogenase (short-subunit alcohol dehydrogenase family)